MQADIESSMVAAAPFVGTDSGGIELSQGVDVRYRPIDPGDAHALQRFHGRLSQRSVYLRFFLGQARTQRQEGWIIHTRRGQGQVRGRGQLAGKGPRPGQPFDRGRPDKGRQDTYRDSPTRERQDAQPAQGPWPSRTAALRGHRRARGDRPLASEERMTSGSDYRAIRQ